MYKTCLTKKIMEAYGSCTQVFSSFLMRYCGVTLTVNNELVLDISKLKDKFLIVLFVLVSCVCVCMQHCWKLVIVHEVELHPKIDLTMDCCDYSSIVLKKSNKYHFQLHLYRKDYFCLCFVK